MEKKKKTTTYIYVLTEQFKLTWTKYKWEEFWKLPCKMLKSSATEKGKSTKVQVIHPSLFCLKEHVSQYAANLIDELCPGWNLLLIDFF